ncbi:MAG: hypothetical protein FWG72_11065 [Oscillospiraceae bacterium]|nr:hypothetical protein [Oscillospiraceae bacterium]
MKTTKILALPLALIMAFALAACSDSSNNSGGSTNTPPPSETPSAPSPNGAQGSGGNDPGSGGSAPLPDGAVDLSAQGDSPSNEVWNLAAGIEYLDEQSGDVFILFGGPQYSDWDRIEIYRGTDENILYLAGAVEFDGNDALYRMYIDKGAAGQGYYYSARAVLGDVNGFLVPPKQTGSRNMNRGFWYYGEDGYVMRNDRFSFLKSPPEDTSRSDRLGGWSGRFRWFDHNGAEIYSREHGRFVFYPNNAGEAEATEVYSQTYGVMKSWAFCFCYDMNSSTIMYVNYDDETFEWANRFYDADARRSYTVDSNIYTAY